MANFLDDEDELEQAAADAQTRKSWLNAAGGVTDALTNVRSASEIALGQSRPQNRFGDSFRAAAANVGDPMDKKAKAMAYLKAKREGAAGEREDALLAQAKDPNSAPSKAAKQIAKRFGIQVTPEMSKYDIDQIIDSKKMMETEAQSRASFGNQVELEKMRQSGDLKKLAAAAATPKGQFDALPEDKKLTVTELSKKNANKISIKNQIDAVMSNWDSLSEDQQLAMGSQLLKTLNSPEGADAVGAEEPKRLGSKLEFAMGNFTNSNPTQFGRDLKGFAEQARNTAKNIGGGVGLNQQLIDEAYGRAPAPKVKQNMSKQELAAQELERRKYLKNTAAR